MAVSESSALRYEVQDPDVRLMLQVRDDDAVAFETLVVRYQNRLINLLRHLTGRADLAEDLSQEVFLRVYRARKQYKPGAKFTTWLFTIAGNVASNARRGMARRREVNLDGRASGPLGGSPMEQLVLAASGQMPTRQLDKSEMQQIVQVAITALNERQRMAVLLSKFEGMSYEDIAEVMETSPKAIKSLLSRARAALREVLQPYLDAGASPSTASDA